APSSFLVRCEYFLSGSLLARIQRESLRDRDFLVSGSSGGGDADRSAQYWSVTRLHLFRLWRIPFGQACYWFDDCGRYCRSFLRFCTFSFHPSSPHSARVGGMA